MMNNEQDDCNYGAYMEGQAQYEMSATMKWVSVKDRLPEFHQDCLFVNVNLKNCKGEPIKTVACGFYAGKEKFKSYVYMGDDWTPTHWMPYPEPPLPENNSIEIF